MQDLSHTSSGYRGKTGQCARDLVSECRRCGTVVCRVSWFLCYLGVVVKLLLKRKPELRHQAAGTHCLAGQTQASL
jgi:hypothetical protein